MKSFLERIVCVVCVRGVNALAHVVLLGITTHLPLLVDL